jgi:hypothetical protein
MSVANGKLLEFFVRIPKLEPDGSNWVIFKDQFTFTAAALVKHINSTDTKPQQPAFAMIGPTLLTSDQITELQTYETNLSSWETGEVVVKQAIASTISDSLFLDV